MSREKGGTVLEHKLEDLRPYIEKVARNCQNRSNLYGTEDLVQEATIVLWRCMEEYPSATETELIRLFKRSLTNRLASLFRRRYIREEASWKSLDDLGMRKEANVDICRDLMRGKVSITPWKFYAELSRYLMEAMGCLKFWKLRDVARRQEDFHKEEVLRLYQEFLATRR